MTHTVRSIDGLISNIPEAQPINPANSPSAKPENKKVDVKAANLTQNAPKIDDHENILTEKLQKSEKPEKIPENSQTDDKKQQNSSTFTNIQEGDDKSSEDAASSENEMDEYGNPVVKAKVYTEEQVQQMIRDRLKRGAFRNEQQPSPQQVQQAQDSGFQYDENSEQTWSQQLEGFVENTMKKVNERHQREQQKFVQKRAQEEFESKFHAGMAKYPDFVQTLQDKPVSDNMMMAVRGLENPAAFLYTAAKKMPGELERISKIGDPYVQAAEMGRLHEKLSKPKSSSNAPRPLSHDRSDISEKAAPARVPIEHLIDEDARNRVRR